MTTPTTPKPNAVSYEAVATVARERVLSLTEELVLKDAQIREQQAYIEHLQAQAREREAPAPHPRPMPPAGNEQPPIKG